MAMRVSTAMRVPYLEQNVATSSTERSLLIHREIQRQARYLQLTKKKCSEEVDLRIDLHIVFDKRPSLRPTPRASKLVVSHLGKTQDLISTHLQTSSMLKWERKKQ